MTFVARANAFLTSIPRTLRWVILVYVLILTTLCIFKYHFFLYDGLDLAIFNQTFWNTVHGRWFEMSVTFPHKYLGDHTGIWLILYLPIYFVFRHPITLLVIQTVVLALAAIPIYLIGAHSSSRKLALLWSFLWLANPYVWNANLFEFHIISIFPLLICSTVYAYIRGSHRWLLFFLALTVLTREDMGLITLGFSAVILFDYIRRQKQIKSSPYIIITHIILSILWTIAAYHIVGTYSGVESTRFLRYYAWLGEGVSGMLHTAYTQPLFVIQHIFSARNIEGVIALLLPFCFFPLYRPKWLLLGSVPLLAMFLISPQVDTTSFLSLHYVLTSLPAFFLAAVVGHTTFVKRHPEHARLSTLLIVIATSYTMIIFGPFSSPDITNRIEQARYHRSVWQEASTNIAPDDRVLSDLAYLPHLSSRERLYNIDQLYIGTLEFSDVPYGPVCDLDKALLTMSGLARAIGRYHSFPRGQLDRIYASMTCSKLSPSDILLDERVAISDRTLQLPSREEERAIHIDGQISETNGRLLLQTNVSPLPSHHTDLLWRLDIIDQTHGSYHLSIPYRADITSYQITSPRFLAAYRTSGQMILRLVENDGTNLIDILQSTQFVPNAPKNVLGQYTFPLRSASQP